MDIIQLIVLSIVQGITEFLPVSSSAHLILVPKLTHWQDQGLLFDVAVHVGTLLAVVCYYAKDLRAIAGAWFSTGFTKNPSNDARLAWAVGFATIPLGLVGLLGKDFIEAELRKPEIIAIATIVFGLLLGGAFTRNAPKRDLTQLNKWDVIWIGLSQALALIPGTSRSGITMTAAFMRDFKPKEAARFSFLLSIPAILMPFSLYLLKLYKEPNVDWDFTALGIAIALSFISAIVCIHFFLKLLERIGMLPFVVYRLILGGVLLYFFLPSSTWFA